MRDYYLAWAMYHFDLANEYRKQARFIKQYLTDPLRANQPIIRANRELLKLKMKFLTEQHRINHALFEHCANIATGE